MSTDHGKVLLQIARASIAEALGIKSTATDDTDKDADWKQADWEQAGWLQQPGACFVTLMQGDQLRGCIGTLEAHRSLLDDVTANARAAALKDTRFSPLSRDEFDETQIEVSLLSAMQPLDFSSEQDALDQLRPGIDGMVFEYGYQRSTFLPQVWEQLPDSRDFMARLKQKAGLPANFWADGVKLFRYTVSKYKESDYDALTETSAETLSEVS
jgi:AmmeMemoRadiSam system protein A